MWTPNYLTEKECSPVIIETYPVGYSKRGSVKMIYRPTRWYTRHGDVFGFSRPGLLSPRTNGVGTKIHCVLQSEIIGGVKEARPGCLKGKLES
ncbi:hypothetical protein TNCV_14361 [Trichonephila clavipes]|nr:hypothetical protein TNCV_14361 [Trichonephila clavipes]